jgi:hypothetical protein
MSFCDKKEFFEKTPLAKKREALLAAPAEDAEKDKGKKKK